VGVFLCSFPEILARKSHKSCGNIYYLPHEFASDSEDIHWVLGSSSEEPYYINSCLYYLPHEFALDSEVVVLGCVKKIIVKIFGIVIKSFYLYIS